MPALSLKLTAPIALSSLLWLAGGASAQPAQPPYPPLRLAGPASAQPPAVPAPAPVVAPAPAPAPGQAVAPVAPPAPVAAQPIDATAAPVGPVGPGAPTAPVDAAQPPSLPPPPALTPSGQIVEQPVPAPAPEGPAAQSPRGPSSLPPPSAPPMKHVPRAFGLAAGWAYTPSNSLPLSPAGYPALTPMGVSIDARFGWQVSGLQRGWPVWVGFMSSFFYYSAGNNLNDALGLDYGIFVKHALFPGPRVRLFLAYGLGAAQVWVRNVGGRGIGHVTRLSAGIDVHLRRSVHLSLEFAYKFVNLPSFAVDQPAESDPPDYGFQSLNLLAGVWFGR